MTAKAALQVEATEDPIIKFEYDGQEYTFSKDDLDDVNVIEAFEDDKLVTPVRQILGAKQWEVFKSKRRTSQDLADMVTKMFDQVGVEPGESAG